MNIFLEYEDIFGKVETAQLIRSMEELLKLAASIRRRLGGKSYLLDQYLSMLLEGAEATKLSSAAERGFYAMNKLWQMCRLSMEGETVSEEHPFFETVRDYVQSHPLP